MEHKPKIISCNQCYFRAKNQNDLDNHKLQHHAKASFSCELCSYKSNWSTYLDHHISTVHNAFLSDASISSEVVYLNTERKDLKRNKKSSCIFDESEYIDESWSINDIYINEIFDNYYGKQIIKKADVIPNIKKEVSFDDISIEEVNIKNEVEKTIGNTLPYASSSSTKIIKQEIVEEEENGKPINQSPVIAVILQDKKFASPNIKIEAVETEHNDITDRPDQIKESVKCPKKQKQHLDKNIPLSDIKHCVSIKNKIGKSPRIYFCKLCESEFMSLQDLTKHQMLSHLGQIFFCNACFYRSDSKAILELHSKFHDDTQCDFCDFSSNYLYDVTEHIYLYHQTKYLNCDRCYYRCKYPVSMMAHKVKHMEYHCNACFIRFETYKEYNSHMKMHPQAHCKYCKSKFISEMNLIRHLKRKKCKEKFIARQNCLKPDKPYFECDICQYRTLNKSTLRRHIGRHMGKGQYSCDLCNFTCLRQVSLVYHKMKHKGILPYCCDKCTFRSSDHYLLSMHRSSHTDNFTCKTCNAKFKSARYLNKHTLTHSKEKHFVCNVCNALFKKKQYLKYHSTVHNDLMRFSCEKCDFKCKRRSQLKEHTIVHHKSISFTCKVCKVVYKTTKHYKLHILSHRNPEQ